MPPLIIFKLISVLGAAKKNNTKYPNAIYIKKNKKNVTHVVDKYPKGSSSSHNSRNLLHVPAGAEALGNTPINKWSNCLLHDLIISILLKQIYRTTGEKRRETKLSVTKSFWCGKCRFESNRQVCPAVRGRYRITISRRMTIAGEFETHKLDMLLGLAWKHFLKNCWF